MTFEQAAGIVGMTPAPPAKPDYRKLLNAAIVDFDHDAEYRMEAGSDILALEIMGQMLARTIRDAELSNRSNCHTTEMRGLVGYTVSPKAIDLIDAFCDQLGPGAEIVRYAALQAMEG